MFHNPDHRALLAEAHRALLERNALLNAPRNCQTTPAADPARRQRSLNYCHYPKEQTPYKPWTATDAYVPELSSRIEDDPNLTDGARRCARKITAYTYRYHRADRKARITVSYLARALGKCRRTVQNYLRELERAGYILVGVIASPRTRMSIGLLVELLAPLFPKHRQQKWPGNAIESGVQKISHNKRIYDSLCEGRAVIPRHAWALHCMDGVFRVLIATLPPVSRVTP
jgi:hypothetical protein